MVRIAFLIAQQSLIVAGGIGQFTKGFVELATELGYEVDLIVDALTADPAKNMISLLRSGGWSGRVFANQPPLSYANFGLTAENRHKDGINFEKEINFRQAMYSALQQGRDYTHILINNPEALLPIYTMGLVSKIATIFYTHNENLVGIWDDIGPYSEEYNEVYSRLMDLPMLVVGTQTHANRERMLENGKQWVEVLHMPVPERELMVPFSGPKEGLLFIGRWEDRKNPKAYIKALKETGLPGRIMTNESGAKKFREAIATANITAPVTFAINVSGKEKVDFIRGSKVFFNPSKKESFGFSVLECHPHCHTILLPYEWTDAFLKYGNVRVVEKKDVVREIVDAYQQDTQDCVSELIAYQEQAKKDWVKVFKTLKRTRGTIPQYKAAEEGSVFFM